MIQHRHGDARVVLLGQILLSVKKECPICRKEMKLKISEEPVNEAIESFSVILSCQGHYNVVCTGGIYDVGPFKEV